MPKTTSTTGAAELLTRIESARAEEIAAWIANRLRDPDDQAAVADTVAGWQAKETIRQLERALQVNRNARRDRARRAREADPAHWPPILEEAGLVSIAAIWPGVPVPADWCMERRSRWSIAEDGVYYDTPLGGRQWVCSPALRTDPGAIVIRRDGEWVTVESKPGSPEASIKAAGAAGLAIANVVVGGERADNPDNLPGPLLVRQWLFGLAPHDAAITGVPYTSFAKARHHRALATKGPIQRRPRREW